METLPAAEGGVFTFFARRFSFTEPSTMIFTIWPHSGAIRTSRSMAGTE